MKDIIKITSKVILSLGVTFLLNTGLFLRASATFGPQEALDAIYVPGMPRELFGANGVINHISNTIFIIIGVLAVIMLIVGGIRYITSGGDSKKVTDAKNTILYAIVGLIISLLSYAIVNFVLNAIGVNTTNACSQC